MPLTDRGRAIVSRLPGALDVATVGLGCEIERHEELCVGCGRCASACPSGASRRGDTFDVTQLLEAPAGSRRSALGDALRRVMRHRPAEPIAVPPRVTVYRTIVHDVDKCLGCGTCARGCPVTAIEARPPRAERAVPSAAPNGGECT
jgi:ferredoxin